VKGVADYDGKIWDVADYIVPPQVRIIISLYKFILV
jgi:hypothetical protein